MILSTSGRPRISVGQMELRVAPEGFPSMPLEITVQCFDLKSLVLCSLSSYGLGFVSLCPSTLIAP